MFSSGVSAIGGGIRGKIRGGGISRTAPALESETGPPLRGPLVELRTLLPLSGPAPEVPTERPGSLTGPLPVRTLRLSERGRPLGRTGPTLPTSAWTAEPNRETDRRTHLKWWRKTILRNHRRGSSPVPESIVFSTPLLVYRQPPAQCDGNLVAT